MRTIHLTQKKILLPILAWWLLFVALSAYNFNQFQLLNIVGFLFLTIVPGLLTVVLAKIKGLTFWGYLALIVGFSLLELMLTALLGNTFLPFLGISQPLNKGPLLIELYLLVGVLAAFAWFRVKEIDIKVKGSWFFDNLRDYVIAFFPIVFVILSIFGTISLNDGGGNILTMVMLGSMGLYLILLLSHVKESDENTTPTAIFFMALSLLLMTSMRGWYITGHDIQNEYKVFELAKNAGFWNIAAYRDAYNACLSITILPTVFFNLLNVPDPYIFKFFFQIFFAICPVLVYLIARNWTSRRISLLATIYFIAFPTFFTDMPFLVRQEVAFLFYGLMLYLIFNPNLELSMRKLLFMLMGIGVILSHYSTTYTILAIFGLLVISRPLYNKFVTWLKNRNWSKDSALIIDERTVPRREKITIFMVVILFVLSFVWTQVITNTGGNLAYVFSQTFSAVENGFGGSGNRSIDATSLLSFTKPNQNQELQDYILNDVDPIRNSNPQDYYSVQSYSQYPFVALNDETVPVTTVGTFLGHIGIDGLGAMTIFGELLAKLMEILAPIGMLYVLFRKGVIKYIDGDIYLMSVFYLIFILACIILPVLSTEYGIYRAMQQAMFIMAPIIALGAAALFRALARYVRRGKKYLTGETFSFTLAVIFFFYSTSFMPYLIGGAPAVLHLSNTGTYYDNYLIQATEVYGVDWLTANASSSNSNGVRLEIQTTKYNKFASLTDLGADTDIFPGVIQKDAYVFLNPTTVIGQRATVVYNADPVNYAYPLQFLSDNKDLIYNNGGAEVYR